MSNWIVNSVRDNVDYNVYEVKCPNCGQKATFTSAPPLGCYVCGQALFMPDGWADKKGE